MRGKKAQFLFTILLVLIVFGLGTRIVNAAEEDESEISEQELDILQEEVQDALMAEFDFDEIEKSLNQMFPQEKITFSEVLSGTSDRSPLCHCVPRQQVPILKHMRA